MIPSGMKETRPGSDKEDGDAASRRLQAELDLSESQVARWSELLGVPVSRDFLLDVGAAGLPCDIEAFLPFWKSTGLSLDIIREAAAAPDPHPKASSGSDRREGRPPDRSRARLAASLALATAAKAYEGDRPEDYAEGLLAAAQACLRVPMWRFAREFAEAAIETKALSATQNAAAVFTVAEALLHGNRFVMARSTLDAISDEVLENCAELHVEVLHARGQCLYAEGEHRPALDAIVRSLHLTPEDSLEVRLEGLALLARILMEAGEVQAAESNIALAVDLSKTVPGHHALADLQALQGRILLRLGREEDAREALLSALMLSEAGTCFEAQLGMFEWETRQGDRSTAKPWEERIAEHFEHHSLPPHRHREWRKIRAKCRGKLNEMGDEKNES